MTTALVPQPITAAEVTTADLERQRQFRENLEANMPQLLAVLPKGISGQALAAASMTAALDNPKLLQCSELSLVRAVFKVATLGLRIGETCDLVPIKNKAECWVRVKGVVDLAVRAGSIKWARDGFVCRGDRFEYEERDTGTHFIHEPKSFPFPNGSNVTHIYAQIRLPGNNLVYEVWPMERCLAHKKRYAPNPKPDSAWAQHPLQMMSKSVLKAGLRFARLSPHIRSVIDDGDDVGEGVFEIDNNPVAALEAADGALKQLAAMDAGAESAGAESTHARETDQGNPPARRMSLLEAEDLVLPGKPKAWAGRAGQRLGALPSSFLSRLPLWIAEDPQRAERYADIAVACDIICAARLDERETAMQAAR